MKIIILPLLLSLHQVAFSQPSEIINFTLTSHNNISVKGVLNQHDTVNLMFHTAASSLMLTEEATSKLKTLVFTATDSVTSWGGASNTSRFSKNNTLQLGSLSFTGLPIWEDQNSGEGTDGKFGPGLFGDKVIAIDFDRKQIGVGPSLPPDIDSYEKLKLMNENGLLFVEASCKVAGRTVMNKFLLHSGYAGAVLLDDQFVTKNQLSTSLKIVGEKVLKDSFGNEIKTQKVLLPAFQIGNQQLNDIPAGFFAGTLGRQKMSIIGGDLLKRFNLVIDAKREFLYIRSNSLTRTPYSVI